MIKKFAFIVAVLFIATTGYAMSYTDNGVVNIDSCYVTDMHALVSGDVVVLQTTSPTYWGREVTGSTTADQVIHGVVLGEYTTSQCKAGTWIRVQTYGYCPIVKVVRNSAITLLNTRLATSGTVFRASGASTTSGNTVALESVTSPKDTTTIKAYLGH